MEKIEVYKLNFLTDPMKRRLLNNSSFLKKALNRDFSLLNDESDFKDKLIFIAKENDEIVATLVIKKDDLDASKKELFIDENVNKDEVEKAMMKFAFNFLKK